MGRGLGLVGLLLAVAIGGYILVVQLRNNGPTAPAVTFAETSGQSNVAATNLQQASTAMQAWYAQNSTYAGATLPVGSNVTLVRADQTSYCLQTTTSPVEHEVGPGGAAQPGPCM